MSDNKNNNHEEPHRRITDIENSLLECKTEMGQELEKGNIRMNLIGSQVKDISSKQEKIMEKMDSIIDIFDTSVKFFKFSGWIGTVLIKLSLVLAAIVAIYHLVTTGEWHK